MGGGGPPSFVPAVIADGFAFCSKLPSVNSLITGLRPGLGDRSVSGQEVFVVTQGCHRFPCPPGDGGLCLHLHLWSWGRKSHDRLQRVPGLDWPWGLPSVELWGPADALPSGLSPLWTRVEAEHGQWAPGVGA